MNQEEVIERWDAFLAKIEDRMAELIVPIQDDGLEMFKESGHDPLPVINTLNSLRIQVNDLGKKIDDTWSEKVRDQMEAAGVEGELLDEQQEKGNSARFTMEVLFATEELDLRKNIADCVVELAQKDQAKTFSCTQCLAPLEIPLRLYRAEHVVCKFCESVNTYEPGTYQRMLAMFIDDLAKAAAREELVHLMQTTYMLSKASDDDPAFKIVAGEENALAKKAYDEKYYAQLKLWKSDVDMEKEQNLEKQREADINALAKKIRS